MMLKQGLHGMLAAGLALLTGCGPTVDDVIGTWTHDEGSAWVQDCGDAPVESDLTGVTITFAAGTTNDLVVVTSSDCLAGYTFDGEELRSSGYEGSTCDENEDALPEGYTSSGELYYVYSSEGNVAKLTPMGSILLTGNGLSCTFSYTGTLSKG